MAGSPPNPPPPTMAAGSSSSSPKSPPPPFPGHLSDVELIDSYLRPRVVSGTKVGFIHEADLYSDYPDLLTRNHAAATSSNGETAWFFFTPLHPNPKGFGMNRYVDTGRKGAWFSAGRPCVKDVLSNGQRIGQRRGFAFKEKVGGNLVQSPWRMMELRLNPIPNQGRAMAGSSDLLALCKVYRSTRNSKPEDGSSMAATKADAEAPTSSAAATPGREGADEEIGAVTAAGPARKKRKAGDKDSGAETVAPSPGRQNKADGEIESADAATTEQIFADKDPLDTPEEAEQEPRELTFYDLFPDE